MKNKGEKIIAPIVMAALLALTNACTAPVRLTASWSDNSVQPVRFSKIAVLSIGKNLASRRLAEDNIKAELLKHGFNAVAGIDEFGPEFSRTDDSLGMRRELNERHFDGALTVRVVRVDEYERWVPGTVYYGPIGFYRGFYGYYYRTWGYYAQPGYRVTDVEVLLESNLYRVQTGELLWSGQSKAFSREPTPGMAAQYAKNIVGSLIRRNVIVH